MTLAVKEKRRMRRRLTPKFSCKHTITIAAKPHPKSAWLLQRSLDSALTREGNASN